MVSPKDGKRSLLTWRYYQNPMIGRMESRLVLDVFTYASPVRFRVIHKSGWAPNRITDIVLAPVSEDVL